MANLLVVELVDASEGLKITTVPFLPTGNLEFITSKKLWTFESKNIENKKLWNCIQSLYRMCVWVIICVLFLIFSIFLEITKTRSYRLNSAQFVPRIPFVFDRIALQRPDWLLSESNWNRNLRKSKMKDFCSLEKNIFKIFKILIIIHN